MGRSSDDQAGKGKGNQPGKYAGQAQARAGFGPAWDPTGTKPDAEKELAERGLIVTSAKTDSRKRRSRPAVARSPGPASSHDPRDLAAELPSRAKRKRERKSRHFRLPPEIDEKLEFLADHHEATMIYIVCKAIQEEWLKTMRQARRDERAAFEAQKAGDDEDANEVS